MNRHYGLIFSVFIHALIFLIPVSLIAKKQAQDMELFVEFEDIPMREAAVRKIPTPASKKNREPEPVQEIVRAVQIPENTAREVVRPAEELTQPPMRVPADETPMRTLPVAPFVPSEPIDTEFGAAVAPSFLHREMPVYPLFARKLGKEGRVLLRLTIDERGNLLHVEVVEKAGYGFVEAAIDAVRMSTFIPARKNGQPVASRALLPVKFTLRRS